MTKTVRMTFATLGAAMLAISLAVTEPASAQQFQRGLVNVQVGDIETGDILSDITVSVGVAANIAANVCGVAVGVIARQVGQGEPFSCETAEQFVRITQ